MYIHAFTCRFLFYTNTFVFDGKIVLEENKFNNRTSEYDCICFEYLRRTAISNLYVDMIAASQRGNGDDRGNSEGEMWNQGVTAQPVQEIQRGPDS